MLQRYVTHLEQSFTDGFALAVIMLQRYITHLEQSFTDSFIERILYTSCNLFI